MTDAIGAIRASVVTGAASRAAAASSVASNTSTALAVSSDIPPLSPAIRLDPKSGIVITEYFDRDGNVATQIPSEASMAYRRSSTAHSSEPAKKSAPEIAASQQPVEA